MENIVKIFKQCEQVNLLSQKQAEFEQNSAEWQALEKELVISEVQILNDIVANSILETDTAEVKQYKQECLSVLPVICLHILKYYNSNFYFEYKEILDNISENALNLLNIIKQMREEIIEEQQIFKNEFNNQ